MRATRPAALLITALCLLAPAAARAAAPRVVVGIQPIHSLAAAVMTGVGSPRLLVPSAVSPHDYTLKPSDARALAQAQLIVWVGEEIESFLEKPLTSLGKKARVVKLSQLKTIALLDAREGGVWEGHDHSGRNEKHHEKDMHIWLSPANAKAIARAIARALGEIDTANVTTYSTNLAKLLVKLDALDAELRERLKPVAGKPYVVFHDAYQYFERHYGLSPVGTVSVTTAHQPGARRLHEIRKKILEVKARCVFREPQFNSKLIMTVTSGTPAKAGALDPLGAETQEGPEGYFGLMQALARSLRACLAPES